MRLQTSFDASDIEYRGNSQYVTVHLLDGK